MHRQIIMALKPKCSYYQKPLLTTPFYKMFNGAQTYEGKYVKVFDNSKLIQLNLNQTLKYNEQVLEDLTGYKYPDNFIQTKIIRLSKEAEETLVILDKYECRLNQFIAQNHPFTEQQALQIFQQLLKSIYSLCFCKYFHSNIRAEHFVKVRKYWKLESMVFRPDFDYDESQEFEYTTKKSCMPPQAYKYLQFQESELDNRMVWDLGCILIHILLGSHKLKSESILSKWKNQQFSFEKLGAMSGKNFSPRLRSMLGKMCHHNVKQRMKLSELFQSQFFSKQISKDFSLHFKNLEINSRLWQRTDEQKMPENIYTAIPYLEEQQQKIEKKKRIGESSTQLPQSKYQSKQPQSKNLPHFNETSRINIILKESIFELKSVLSESLTSSSLKISEIYATHLGKCCLVVMHDEKMQLLEELIQHRPFQNQLSKFAPDLDNRLRILSLKTLSNLVSLILIADLEYQNFYRSIMEDYRDPELTHYNFLTVFSQTSAYKKLRAEKKKIQLQRLQQYERMKAELLNHIALMRKAHGQYYKGLDYTLQSQLQNLLQSIKTREAFVDKAVKINFVDVKKVYRKILLPFYSKAIEEYECDRKGNKNWAGIGCHLTFCLSVDKIYSSKHVIKNFTHFFESSKEPVSKFNINSQKLEYFFNHADSKFLVLTSREIITRYFQNSLAADKRVKFAKG